MISNEVNSMKFLKDILAHMDWKEKTGSEYIAVQDVTADSRTVGEGSLFICLRGAHSDGHDFAAQAVRSGASVIVADRPVTVPEETAVVYVKDTRTAMEQLTPYFFDYPSRKMRMIAVTGTNGKTTTTHIAAHILRKMGYKTGVIGTVHMLIDDEVFPTHNTTPDVVDLQKMLQRMVSEGVTHVCMEVSSHALVMGRVAGCEFDTAVFTNLTEDHLDFHKTMDNYARAKSILFSMVSSEGQHKKGKHAVINADDPYAAVMENAVGDTDLCPVSTYGIRETADLRAEDIRFTGKSSSFSIEEGNRTWPVRTRMAGRFNVYNTLASVGAAQAEGVPMDVILEGLADFTAVPGRFELIDEGQSFSVVVDYAHTPDGLENILKTAREITKGRVIAVFGCGGDRDKMKRPIMGRIAASYGDLVIVTSDNPRTEDPDVIVKEVAAGVIEKAKEKPELEYRIIADRRSAIRSAIGEARPGDIVLIAGKGHENYQILKDRTIHFDDREEARAALKG